LLPVKNEVLINFGKRVRELRKSKNWTQEKLAEISGLHPNYIGMVERGERNPSLVNIEILAKALNTTLSKIFEV
jgi:transcriptional regulator with XRE-family HTH domain